MKLFLDLIEKKIVYFVVFPSADDEAGLLRFFKDKETEGWIRVGETGLVFGKKYSADMREVEVLLIRALTVLWDQYSDSKTPPQFQLFLNHSAKLDGSGQMCSVPPKAPWIK